MNWGAIMFIPESGTPGPKTGTQINNGQFELDKKRGPCIGTLRVRISNQRDPAQTSIEEGDAKTETKEPSIPPRYNRYTQLVIETSAVGDNYFEFDLTTDSPNTQ